MIPGTDGRTVVEWAKRAEQRGFSALGVFDRIVYDNYEPLIALAAAAAVTERIRLFTSILIAPYRGTGALLAKQAASVDRLAGGRLVLGMAVGNRDDDYRTEGADFPHRGKHFDAQLEEMTQIWAGESRGIAGRIGPVLPEGRPHLAIGGRAPASFARLARYGDSWIAGGAPPEVFAKILPDAKAAWAQAGRAEPLRASTLAYFGLGEDAQRHANDDLLDYYSYAGPAARSIAAGAHTSEDKVRTVVEAFTAAGLDELILFPTNADPAQVDLLADVVF